MIGSRTSPLVVVMVCGLAGAAVAQPGAPVPPPVPPDPIDAPPDSPVDTPPDSPYPPVAYPVPMPPPPPAPEADPFPNTDRGVVEDANSGRSWLSPTALTNPKGTWTFTDFELFVVGASYSITDALTLSATTLIPISDEQPFIGMVTGKLQLLRSGRVRVAAQGAFNIVTGTTDFDAFGVGVLGGVATLCLDDLCRSHVTGYLGAGFSRESTGSAVPFLASGSAAFRLGRRVKLVFEVDSGFVLGEIDASADALLAWYGVRFTSSAIGVDVGFVKPVFFDDTSSEGAFPMGFPVVSFTYRGLPGD